MSDIPVADGIEARIDPALSLWALFQAQTPIAHDVAIEVFGEGASQALLGSGFVVEREGELQPVVEISLWNGLLICADVPGYAGSDAVFSVSETTEQLDALRLPVPAGLAIDVGTGSGALALRLAAQSERVTGVDLNPRAVAFTQVNCLLNGIGNVTVRQGNLLSGVEAGSADLILGNLPFVISPDQSYLYRDGNCDSHALTTEVIRQADTALAPGGFAQFLCSWTAGPDRLPSYCAWLNGICCDSLVIGFAQESPGDHAESWLAPEDFPSRGDFVRATRRWVRWLEEAEVQKVVSGVINLRTQGASLPARVYLEGAASPKEQGGVQVRDIFGALDLPDEWERLRELTPRLVPHAIFQRLDHTGNGYASRAASLVACDSAGVSCFVEPEQFPLLFAMDGSKTAGELADEDPEARKVLRDLLAHGLAVMR